MFISSKPEIKFMRRLFLTAAMAASWLLLSSLASPQSIEADDVIEQVREIVEHPNMSIIRMKEDIPATIFETLNTRLHKEYKSEDYQFELLNGNELVPGTKRVGTNSVSYRKLNFAYTVGEQWIISYYHNNGRVGFQQILVIDMSKKRNNIASLLVDSRPRSPENLLAWMESQDKLDITYPTESEPDFLIF